MRDFNGKIAFITGGASGAGLGQAKVFAEAGCRVVIADVRQDHLDEARAYFRDRKIKVHAIKLDITDRKAYAAAADEVEKVFGSPPQLLINTAGVNTFGPAEASTFEDYDWVMGGCLGGGPVRCPFGINPSIHEATFPRPKHLQNTGYNVNPETLEFEHRIYMQGI